MFGHVTPTLFFLGGGVSCELLTISWVGVSARVDSACCGGLQLKTPMSRGISASLRRERWMDEETGERKEEREKHDGEMFNQ